MNRVRNTHFELRLGLFAVADSLAQFVERWRVDKQKVSLECFRVQLDRTLHINLNNWNLALVLDTLKFRVGSPVHVAVKSLLMFYKLICLNHFSELCFTYEVEFSIARFTFFLFTSRVGFLKFKKFSILFKHSSDQGSLSNARGSNYYQWFILERSRVKGMEVLLGKYKDIVLKLFQIQFAYWFVEKHT